MENSATHLKANHTLEFISQFRLSEKISDINEHKQRDSSSNPKKFNVEEILGVVFHQNLKKEEITRTLQRKQQPKWVYFLTLLLTVLTGTQNLYIFLWESFQEKDKYLFMPTLILRPFFFVASSFYLSRNWKVILKIYASFDRILVAEIAMMISVGVFATKYIPYTNNSWIYYSLYGLYPILLLTFSGYYRIMMIYCKWKPWQTILIKIAVAAGAGAYFGLGMYYTVVDGKFTDGASEELDGVIINILLLFAFAGFDYHLQIFSIIDETDGTNKYNLTYELESTAEDIECLLGKGKRRHEKQKKVIEKSARSSKSMVVKKSVNEII